jgi:hypothetical protein
MIVVEEQAKVPWELGVDVARGAKDGGQERDTMIVSVGMLILIDFLPGGFTQQLVDVGRVLKLACLGRIVLPPPKRSWVMEMFLIAGGLYSVPALRECDQERVTVYTKHRLTLQALVTEALGS